MFNKKTKPGVSYATLKTDGIVKMNLVKRDIAEFEKRGITMENVNRIIEELELINSDALFLDLQKEASNAKRRNAQMLRNVMGELKIVAQLTWGVDNVLSEIFTGTKLNLLKDSELLTESETLLQKAREREHEMVAAGINTDILSEYETVLGNYKSSLLSTENMYSVRKNATGSRVADACSVRNKIALYCKMGRCIWYGRDLVKYNEYKLKWSPPDKSANTDSVPSVVTNLNLISK